VIAGLNSGFYLSGIAAHGSFEDLIHTTIARNTDIAGGPTKYHLFPITDRATPTVFHSVLS
jgi:hypothetical protein